MDMGKDLVAASATPLVLAILAEGESYGYAIIKRVAELSGGHLEWTDGMLYLVLHRLERQGHVAAKWSASENGRRRKYYRITVLVQTLDWSCAATMTGMPARQRTPELFKGLHFDHLWWAHFFRCPRRRLSISPPTLSCSSAPVPPRKRGPLLRRHGCRPRLAAFQRPQLRKRGSCRTNVFGKHLFWLFWRDASSVA